jgi:hypothetical protein
VQIIICGMNESAFDWSPLGEGFWLDAQKTTGASAMQTRFACCRHQGKTATLSAKLSGYGGEGVNLRGAGHRAGKSNAVMSMVQLAQIEQAGGDDGTLGGPEARRILSKLARGSDPSVRIKAIETLNRIDREERDRQVASSHTPTWSESAIEVLAIGGEMGVGLIAMTALADGIDISLSPFREIAPHIRAYWPDIWGKLLSQIGRINPDTKLKWIEYGDAPLVDLSKFAKSAPAKPRHNGAARPVIESEEAASAAL